MIVKIPNLLKIFRKESRTWQAIIGNFGVNPQWTKKDYKKLTEAGYYNTMVVYACVNLIAKACAGIPWVLNKLPRSSREKIKQLDDHDLINLIRRPNPYEGQAAFVEKAMAYYLLSGNDYIEDVGPSGKPPKELYALRPDRMTIHKSKTKKQLVGKYVYKVHGVKGEEFKPEEILHLKMFHPLDDFYGMSPIEAAAKGIDILNMSMAWNMNLLQNDMRPGGVFSVEGTLTDEQFERLDNRLKKKYAGHEKAGKFLVLEGGTKWQQTALRPKDLDWLNSEKATMRKICTVYNVPSELLGDSENKTYSNVKEARKALYMETVLPLMDYFRDELNNWLTPKFEPGVTEGQSKVRKPTLRLEYDRNAIEALREEMTAIFDRMAKAWWLSPNERRIACGYEEDPSKEASLIWHPIGLVNMGGGGDVLKKYKELKASRGESFWQKKEHKTALWTHFTKRVEMKEKILVDPVRAFLKKQADLIADEIRKQGSVAEVDVPKLLDVDDEGERFLKKFKKQYITSFAHAGEVGVQASAGKLMEIGEEFKQGEEFEMTPKLVAEIESIIVDSGSKIAEASLRKVSQLVLAAEQEGWTVEELAKNTYAKLEDLSMNRARTVARTEMVKVENFGQVEGYKQSKLVERKGWLSAKVPGTRQAHEDADAEYSDYPIPLDEPFNVGGEPMQYPGDGTSASAANIVNCLCTTYPEVAKEA
jgi:HK97 family phage portal protein